MDKIPYYCRRFKMSRLCKKCLHELHNKEKTCPICGTKMKSNFLKFTKIACFSAIPLALLVSIFLYIAHSNSKPSITEKFSTSLSERDTDQLQKLIIHQDGSAISKVEAQAVIALIKEIGEIEVEQLFFPVQTNKLLDIYKITAHPVSFAPLEEHFALVLKDTDVKNLIPGKYKLKITHEDTLNSDFQLNVAVTEKNTVLPQQLHLRKIKLRDNDSFPIQFFNQTRIKMNDTIARLEDIVTDEDLSVFSYQMPQYQIVSTWPWGDISSEKKTLVEDIIIGTLPIVSKEDKKVFSKMLTETLTALSENKMPTKYTSKDFQKNLPILEEVLPSPIKISFIEEQFVTQNKEGLPNGGGFHAMTKDGMELDVVFGYEMKKKEWLIHSLYSPLFSNQEELMNRYDEDFQDALYVENDLYTLTKPQLKFLFTSLYTTQFMYYPELLSSKSEKVDERLYGCTNGNYVSTDIQSVSIQDNDHVKIQALDTCSDEEQFVSTTLLNRAYPNVWEIKKIESRTKFTTP